MLTLEVGDASKPLPQFGFDVFGISSGGHMLNPNVRPEGSDNISRRRRQALKTDNPVGKRIDEALGGRTLKWLSSKSGVSESTLGDYVKKGISRADYGVQIAAALERTLEWLVTGHDSAASKPLLVTVDDADWVTISEYDLRELTDEGKGDARTPSPFRRDWLNQTLGTATGLWLTRMLSDYAPAGLAEGTLVFCLDVEPAALLEGQLCLFRINGGLVVGRFSYRATAGLMAAGDRLGEVIITSGEIGHEDNQYLPIARILGRFIGRL